MTTDHAAKTPATRYDSEIADMEAMVRQIRATSSWPLLVTKLTLQEGYRAAIADLALLHRQMVEALRQAYEQHDSELDALGRALTEVCEEEHWCWKARAALDAARKAGLS